MFTADKMISFPKDTKDPSTTDTSASIPFNPHMFMLSNSSISSGSIEKLAINGAGNHETENKLLRTIEKSDRHYKTDLPILDNISKSVSYTPVYVSSLGELSTHSEDGFDSNRVRLLELSEKRTFPGFADKKKTKPKKNREYI